MVSQSIGLLLDYITDLIVTLGASCLVNSCLELLVLFRRVGQTDSSPAVHPGLVIKH